MKTHQLISIIIVALPVFLISVFLSSFKKSEYTEHRSDTYVLIAWNDLGMHCSNKYFNNFCVLPPYNNQHAQLIKVGDSLNLPQILTNGFHTTYEIPGNTYSVGKTDFWTYVNALFGVTLANNIGLTGVGLSGDMSINGNYFQVEGIPVTPYPDNDLVNEHPYQLALIKVYDNSNNFITSTQSVIPVSNEFSCISSGCHTSESQLLSLHESVSGYNATDTPIMCADCHKDNALGMPGIAEAHDFSQVIHQKHGEETNDCYKCHPGPNAQCFRDIMKQGGMICQDCHGTVSNVGNTIENGREAWLEEPDCGNSTCHGSNYASQPGMLYRNSKGHSGLYCSACHGSPHAILPSLQPNDNLQNIALQGYAGTLNKCSVCHGITPTGPGPHGLYASVTDHNSNSSIKTHLGEIFPNPLSEKATISFFLEKNTFVTLQVYNQMGQCVLKLIEKQLIVGSYSIAFDAMDLASGTYFYNLNVEEKSFTKKMIVLK